VEKEVVITPYMRTMAQMSSQLTAVIALYPIETIINRLIVQGTRTIIDNTDTGCGVLPINTRYEGFTDCARTIIENESVFGLYKGLGAVIAELILSYALIKLAKVAAIRLYDSEWITRSDQETIKTYMTASSNR
jgi:solute carrier family 25 protein 46